MSENFVGKLNELKEKVTYVESQDSDTNLFGCECVRGSQKMKTENSYRTKKEAKQAAAQLMLMEMEKTKKSIVLKLRVHKINPHSLKLQVLNGKGMVTISGDAAETLKQQNVSIDTQLTIEITK